MGRDISFPPSINNGQQYHTTSRNNEFHTRDANPRAPPKDMEKMMGILLHFAAPRRRRNHVDRNRKPSRQRPS